MIVTLGANERVRPGSVEDKIVPRTPDADIIACPNMQLIVACLTNDHKGASTIGQCVRR